MQIVSQLQEHKLIQKTSLCHSVQLYIGVAHRPNVHTCGCMLKLQSARTGVFMYSFWSIISIPPGAVCQMSISVFNK